MKVCSRCNQEKPLTEFYASNSGSQGLRYSSACKPCSRDRAAERKREKGDYSLRWQRRQEGLKNGTKWCPGCDEFRLQEQFAMRSYKGEQRSDYRASLCYACAAGYRKKYFHGMTPEEYDAILVAQDYRCASCCDPFDSMDSRCISIDHCHSTGKIRGVLCNHCNLALGHLKDDLDRITALLGYLNATSA